MPRVVCGDQPAVKRLHDFRFLLFPFGWILDYINSNGYSILYSNVLLIAPSNFGRIYVQYVFTHEKRMHIDYVTHTHTHAQH